MKKTSRKKPVSPGVAAGADGSAALVAYLRCDADDWEACGNALGYMDKAGERRGKRRIAMLRSAADRIEHMLQTLHMAYEHALDTQCPPDQRRLTPDGERELGRRLAQYWCLPNTRSDAPQGRVE